MKIKSNDSFFWSTNFPFTKGEKFAPPFYQNAGGIGRRHFRFPIVCLMYFGCSVYSLSPVIQGEARINHHPLGGPLLTYPLLTLLFLTNTHTFSFN